MSWFFHIFFSYLTWTKIFFRQDQCSWKNSHFLHRFDCLTGAKFSSRGKNTSPRDFSSPEWNEGLKIKPEGKCSSLWWKILPLAESQTHVRRSFPSQEAISSGIYWVLPNTLIQNFWPPNYWPPNFQPPNSRLPNGPTAEYLTGACHSAVSLTAELVPTFVVESVHYRAKHCVVNRWRHKSYGSSWKVRTFIISRIKD